MVHEVEKRHAAQLSQQISELLQDLSLNVCMNGLLCSVAEVAYQMEMPEEALCAGLTRYYRQYKKQMAENRRPTRVN